MAATGWTVGGGGGRSGMVRAVALLALGALLALAQAGVEPARGAIPATGTFLEGVGPAAAAIGSSGRAVARRWGLVCRPIAAGDPIVRCFTSLTHAINFVQYGGDGRVEALTFAEPGWRSARGIGVGSPIGAVLSVYRGRLTIRRTPVWTYLDLNQRVNGQRRTTAFLGRTKVGDVVSITVYRRRAQRLRLRPLAVPAGGGLTVSLVDFEPVQPVDAEIRLPWNDTAFAQDLVAGRIGRNGAATLAVAPKVLARLIAQRPAGTAGPVRARVEVGGRGGVSAAVRLALPALPTLSAPPGLPAPDATVPLTLTGHEPFAFYSLSAEWTCPTGQAGRLGDVAALPPLASASVQVPIDVASLVSQIYDPSCAGATPPASVPATIVLLREDANGRTERAATATLTVPAPPA